MTRPPLVLTALFLICPLFAPGQPGVIQIQPDARTESRCLLYIAPDLVVTFSVGIDGRPAINVINYGERERSLDAARIEFQLDSGEWVRPSVLKIPTGLPGDYLFRAYVTLRPQSALVLEPDLAEADRHRVQGMRLRLGDHRYLLEPVRREIFDVMLDRLATIATDSPSVRRAFRTLSIPLKGTRERAGH